PPPCKQGARKIDPACQTDQGRQEAYEDEQDGKEQGLEGSRSPVGLNDRQHSIPRSAKVLSIHPGQGEEVGHLPGGKDQKDAPASSFEVAGSCRPAAKGG